jgi:hypothetical protein
VETISSRSSVIENSQSLDGTLVRTRGEALMSDAS